MIEELLPAAVAAAESFGPGPDQVVPYSGEEQQVSRAVAKRRREFVNARACARQALGHLGIAPVAIPSGPRGAPVWPDGVVGSITHCDGYCAAVAARRTELTSVGIDAERLRALPEGVLEAIARPEERRHVAALSAAVPRVNWGLLVFSAKESLYKAWFPVTGRQLGFEEARVHPDPEGGFVAEILVPAPEALRRPLRGRWAARDGLMLTALAVAGGQPQTLGDAAPPHP